MRRRPALGALFLLLACGFAGMAYAAGRDAGDDVGRWIVAGAAVALAIWLATMAFRAVR